MIKNMNLYHLVFPREDYMEVLLKLENTTIYPIEAKKVSDNTLIIDDRNPYNDILDELYNIMAILNINKEVKPITSTNIKVEEVNHYIEMINQKLEEIKEIKKGIEHDYYENQEAIELITCLNKDHISIDDIQELKYITLRFGKLPTSQLEKIQYFDKYPFIYQELSNNNQYHWIVYGGVKQNIEEIDNIFSSMNFEEVALPHFAHGKMEEAIKELKVENKAMEAYFKELDDKVNEIKKTYQEQIINDFNQISYLKELYKKGKYVVDLKSKAAIYLFSTYSKEELIDIINLEELNIRLLPNITYKEQGIIPPVVVENNSFFKPFESLFTFNHGDKFDPTIIMSLIIMFTTLLLGDLGVGILALLVSLIIKDKGKLIQRISLAFIIGGLLRGSVFYNMTLYNLNILPDINSFIIILYLGINVISYIVLVMLKKMTNNHLKVKGDGHGNS